MSKWGERGKEHYRGMRPRVFEVSWLKDEAGNPLIVHARVASAGAGKKIVRAGQESVIDAYVEAIVLLSHNEQGEKIFDAGDRFNLMDWTKDGVEEIGGKIIRNCTDIELHTPFKDIVKNSVASQSA